MSADVLEKIMGVVAKSKKKLTLFLELIKKTGKKQLHKTLLRMSGMCIYMK